MATSSPLIAERTQVVKYAANGFSSILQSFWGATHSDQDPWGVTAKHLCLMIKTCKPQIGISCSSDSRCNPSIFSNSGKVEHQVYTQCVKHGKNILSITKTSINQLRTRKWCIFDFKPPTTQPCIFSYPPATCSNDKRLASRNGT